MLYQNFFVSILTSEMKLAGINWPPYQLLPCLIHKLMIQPFQVECFTMKMFKFQQYDVTSDFIILFGMWNNFVISYPCAKFQHDMTINNGINYIFPGFCLVYFWINNRSLRTIFLDKRQKSQCNDVINFMQILFIFELKF